MNGGPSALARHFVAVTDEIPRSVHSYFSSMSMESVVVIAQIISLMAVRNREPGNKTR